jgi:hypothetical protein
MTTIIYIMTRMQLYLEDDLLQELRTRAIAHLMAGPGGRPT